MESHEQQKNHDGSQSELSGLVMCKVAPCKDGRLASVPHPPWATHAAGGFSTSDECIDHADANSPSSNYGITFQVRRDGEFIWQWFYPEYKHQRRDT